MSESNQIEADNGFEAIASSMIEKYPEGHITEIEIGWPCRSGIRAQVRGLDTPVAIFTGSYQELNAFEHAYHRAKRVAGLLLVACLLIGPAMAMNETQAAYLEGFDAGYLMGSLHMEAYYVNETAVHIFNENVIKFNEWANATFMLEEARRICLALIERA